MKRTKLSLAEAVERLATAEGGPLGELRRRGLRSVKAHPRCCIVAVCLSQDIGEAAIVEPTYFRTEAGVYFLDVPASLRNLIEEFDKGLHPELEEVCPPEAQPS